MVPEPWGSLLCFLELLAGTNIVIILLSKRKASIEPPRGLYADLIERLRRDTGWRGRVAGKLVAAIRVLECSREVGLGRSSTNWTFLLIDVSTISHHRIAFEINSQDVGHGRSVEHRHPRS